MFGIFLVLCLLLMFDFSGIWSPLSLPVFLSFSPGWLLISFPSGSGNYSVSDVISNCMCFATSVDKHRSKKESRAWQTLDDSNLYWSYFLTELPEVWDECPNVWLKNILQCCESVKDMTCQHTKRKFLICTNSVLHTQCCSTLLALALNIISLLLASGYYQHQIRSRTNLTHPSA